MPKSKLNMRDSKKLFTSTNHSKIRNNKTKINKNPPRNLFVIFSFFFPSFLPHWFLPFHRSKPWTNKIRCSNLSHWNRSEKETRDLPNFHPPCKNGWIFSSLIFLCVGLTLKLPQRADLLSLEDSDGAEMESQIPLREKKKKKSDKGTRKGGTTGRRKKKVRPALQGLLASEPKKSGLSAPSLVVSAPETLSTPTGPQIYRFWAVSLFLFTWYLLTNTH